MLKFLNRPDAGTVQRVIGRVAKLSRRAGRESTMKHWSYLLFTLLLAWAAVAGAQEFLPPDEAFQVEVHSVDDDAVTLHWTIAEGYYLYRHAVAAQPDDGAAVSLGEPELPDGQVLDDPYFGRTEIYYDSLTVRVPLDTNKALPDRFDLAVAHQGCADGGICYPPQTTTLTVSTGSGSGSGAAASDSAAATNQPAAPPQDRLAAMLGEASMSWVLFAFFGAGLLLAFTPCVLPMIPILSSIIVGSGTEGSSRRGLTLSVAYVLPMAVGYALLGTAAGLAGANLQAYLQTPWVIVPFVIVFGLLAMAMFGFFQLRLPAAMQSRLTELSSRQRGGTLIGVAAMGLLSALIVGPCMTAPLAGALLYISQTGDAVLGGLALFVLGLGMGTPLVIAGTFGARVLPKAGPWMTQVQAVFGFVLLAMAIWMLDRVVPAPVTVALWGLLLTALAVNLGALEPLPGDAGPRRRATKVIGVAAGLWSIALVVGAAAGSADPLRPLAFLNQPSVATPAVEAVSQERIGGIEELRAQIAEANAAGKPVVVDFYADWCISCKVMERRVFGNSEVQQAMADVVRLKPDVTANDASDREMMQALGVLGPPTLMFFGTDGEERAAQRIVGEVGPREYLRRLQEAF